MTLESAVYTDLVLLFLDDFYLRGPTDSEKLQTCIALMQRNERVANVLLFSSPIRGTPSPDYPWLLRRARNGPYLFSLQAGLWRRERLLHFLRDHESPWYFERWGSVRARRYHDEFYGVESLPDREAVFDYRPSEEGLSRGKWLPNTPQLFSRERIDVDLSLRGVLAPGDRTGSLPRHPLRSAWNVFRSLRP